jgi:mono/diheme cytochrome c family protein
MQPPMLGCRSRLAGRPAMVISFFALMKFRSWHRIGFGWIKPSTPFPNIGAGKPAGQRGQSCQLLPFFFLRNCAHCHGASAHDDDEPDLHDLGLSDDWIANRIRKGKAGEMTAFAGKLQPAEIAALVAYVQSLK